jgi:hypothetical protein
MKDIFGQPKESVFYNEVGKDTAHQLVIKLYDKNKGAKELFF